VLILPYIEQGNAYQLWKTTLAGVNQVNGINWFDTVNPVMDQARNQQVSVFFCPSRRSPPQLSKPFQYPTGNFLGACSDYAVNLGDIQWDRGTFLVTLLGQGVKFSDISDGLSNTLLLGEKHIQLNDFGNVVWDYTVYSGDSAQQIGRL